VESVPVQLLPAWNKAIAHTVIKQCLVRYICDFGIPRKWQTENNSVFANEALNWGKTLQNFWDVASSFWRRDNGK